MDVRSGRVRLSVGKRLAFAMVPVLLIFLLLEVVIRVQGLAETCPNAYTGGSVWTCDPILHFKLRPDLIAGGQPLNHAGFRTHEFTPKAEGVYRVLSLGDSCTFGITTGTMFEYIPEPYPQRLEHLFAERVGPGKVEVLNAGVAGYNSYHGIMLLRTKLRDLEPDLITVRYGWNDHLMSNSPKDAYREPASRIGLMFESLFLRTAIYPYFRRLEMQLASQRTPPKPLLPITYPKEWNPDIPIELYKHNLRRIADLGHAQGAEVWFLTSPHAFLTDENRGQYDKFPNTSTGKGLLAINALPNFDRLIEIHEAYNDAAREVGRELGVPVVDMDAQYRKHSSAHLYGSTDVPHPNQEGHNLEAEVLYERMLAAGVIRTN
jgi:lysophospholipase L1-like esterase